MEVKDTSVELVECFWLRRAAVEDHAAMCNICFQTGDAGAPITDIEPAEDVSLIGKVYAIPYQIFEPDFAFVLEDRAGVCGYTLAARDASAFHARLERDWLPTLRAQVPDPGPDESRWRGRDWLRYMIHHPENRTFDGLKPYPAEAHIDLLARAQGRGAGRRAMRHLMEYLAAAGVPGLHLRVNPRNSRARVFYNSLDFQTLKDPDFPTHIHFMARKLP